ncbi:hypothetical protein HN51_069303 [Arachis hypogaea]|uniref:putative disease resistance protein RGA4 n=1 Tax=Arachis ipaensis TaxID=130454 RepID=UPI000A2B8AF3|nr:putative disease resistance protein RGA4 [Arachis ipaensis]
MATALLGIVIGNLQNFVQNELATICGVESHTVKLCSNLNSIHAVLQDAEEKQITERAVKLWLQKLSDAAYVLDDILDECSIESNRLVLKAHVMCFACFHPRIILFRRDIGRRMKEITKRFHEIDEERRKFELRAGVAEREQEDDQWRQTSSVRTEQHLYGRDQDRDEILKFLLSHSGNSDELSVYPIVGIGGLGKTTLAQWIFNDDCVIKHFDLRIWVCISNDFNIMRILQSIVESITLQNPNLSTLESMQKKVQEMLLRKRYLLVLDDAWNEDQEEWKKLKCMLQCGSGVRGSVILVTTRNESVASIMETCSIHRLLPLSENDNWSLFKHHAFGNNEESAELEKIGKEIVKKCVGSPLASKVLGSLLRNKSEKQQWLGIKESKIWNISGGDAIMRALRISYFNLKLSLRQCFSFCAIYPEDFRILKEELIHLWMANGLIKSEGNLEVEHVGNDVWDELCQRSFFEEVKVDLFGNVTFKIHDLFHELAQSIVGEECKVSKSANLSNLSSRLHHISLVGLDGESKFNMGAFKKVESLRTFIEFDSFVLFNSHGLPPFNSLRALSMSSMQLSALKSLTHLRYLNICNSLIITLPECISMLRKLQVLKLYSCFYLRSLPKHLTCLQDLRHLSIQRCPSLVSMPSKIGTLKCLKTLSTFIVDSKAGSSIAELRDLNLGGKLHIKGLENVLSESDARAANLISKKNLNRLYLSWGNNNADSEKVLNGLEPHSNLKSFGMKGYGGTQLAPWLRNTSLLSSLVSVTFHHCKSCKQLPPLGKLPHLTYLSICGMEGVEHINDDSYEGFEEKAFKSLKKLMLHGLPNFISMLKDEGAEMLPNLLEVSISSVPKFKLPCLPSVKNLEIQDMASFPVEIVHNLDHVETLCVEYFPKLKALPDVLCSLSLLQTLEIGYCDELEFFSENVLQGLNSLRALSIHRYKKLKSLSEGVRHLTYLQCLDIAYCPELVAVPSSVNVLTTLHHVTIIGGDHNRVLPKGLQGIPSLQTLSLYNVDSLPEWLGDMTSLQELRISYCPELKSLPSSFGQLTNLHKLLIEKSPMLEKRCKRITGEDWQHIAHISELKLVSGHRRTFCEKIRFNWNSRKILFHNLMNGDQCLYLDDEFDMIADDPKFN